MSTHLMTKQYIIQEIEKAFKNINAVCHQYFENKKNTSIKNQPYVSQHKSFNQYKHNQKNNEFQHIKQWNNNTNQNINLINDQNPFTQTYKNTQHYENQPENVEISRVIPKPKPQIVQTSRGNSQTGGKYSLAPKNSQIPLPPKAPLSPYFTFYKQKKDLIKQEFPEMSITQLASAAAKVWKSLTEEQKGPYNRKYFEEKKEYESKMSEYVSKYPNYKELLKSTNTNKGVKK